MQKQENTILQGKVFPPLIRFTLPIVLSILVQALYGAVDLIVVGKFGSTASVSAVANGGMIMHTISGLIFGLTTGVTVLVGNRVGAKDDVGAANAVGGMVRLFSAVTVLLTVLLLIFAEDIVRIMLIPVEARPGAVTYLRVCSSGLVFIAAFNALGGLFRGAGNSKSPLLFVSIACGVNIALDLLFVGVFGLDVFGAAIATVLAQGVSAALSLNKIRRGGLPFRLTRQNFKSREKTVSKILKIGLPLSFQEFLTSISFLIIMAVINDISLVASASIGIAERLFVFLAIIPMAFFSSLSAFVAQNAGAGQERRALRALYLAVLTSFAVGIGMTALTFFAGDKLAAIFEKNPEVIASTWEYLRGVSLEYMLIPPIFCVLGYFNGIGSTTFVMLEGVLTAFLVRIPLSYYFSRLPDTNLFTIALAVPIAAMVSFIACALYFIHVRKKRLGISHMEV